MKRVGNLVPDHGRLSDFHHKSRVPVDADICSESFFFHYLS